MADNFSDVANIRQSELSFVNSVNFYMVAERAPQTYFTVVETTLPQVAMGETILPNSLNPNRTPMPGDGIEYSSLDITYLINKDYANYRELLKWMKAAAYPETTDQFKNYNAGSGRSDNSYNKIYSNMAIVAVDSANRPLVEWRFYNAFPVALDGGAFNAQATDVEYIRATATFRYHYFEHFVYDSNGALNQETKI